MKTLNIKTCKHIFKLDPAKEISDSDLERVCEANTDLIIVGGTDQITEDNVLNLLARIRRFSVNVALEISTIDVVIPGFDHYFVPMVFNTTNMYYQHGQLLDALKEYEHLIDFDDITVLPYIILNDECKAFKKAECQLIESDDVVHYAKLLYYMYQFDMIYVEYSGRLGETNVLDDIKHTAPLHIIYGGGINTREDAKLIKTYADTIVVGNRIYTNIKEAIRTTKI